MTELRVALEDTPRTGPGNKYRRTVLGAVINHFDKNNGMWDDFVHYLAAKPQIRLAPQPLPARTHDAVAKKAA